MVEETKKKKDSRKVRFGEHDDIFIIHEDEEGSFILPDTSELDNNNSAPTTTTPPAVTSASPDDIVIVEEMDNSSDSATKSTDYQNSVVDIRESMRDCILTWSKTPYWKLLEGSVDDDEGEAKDVQRYITCFARVEVDGDCPRGLERQLCRSHHEARKALYDNATHAVLSNDFRLRFETPNKSDDDIWKELRHIYKEHSRGAKAFARKVGKADEAAVQRCTVDHEQAMEQIEDLQARAKKGELRSTTRRTSSSELKRCSTTSAASASSVGSSSRRRSRSMDPLGQDSDHFDIGTSQSKRDSNSSKGSKKERKTPLRIPSLSMYRSRQSSKKDVTVVEDDTNTTAGSHAHDLFHDVDKKGKTKRSSRWRSLKKGISKRVHSSSHRTQ